MIERDLDAFFFFGTVLEILNSKTVGKLSEVIRNGKTVLSESGQRQLGKYAYANTNARLAHEGMRKRVMSAFWSRSSAERSTA